MKNVYDILVNFKNKAYEFYEWEQTDAVNHVKKIPSFKVNDLTMYEFTNYDVSVSREFLEKIYDKTEVFYNRMIKKIPYACILFNDEFSLALVFDETGRIFGKSKLLFDESDDVVEKGKDLECYDILYNVTSKEKVSNSFTRKEGKLVLLLTKYLDKIYECQKKDEMKYLYYECFNEEENDFLKAYEKIKQNVLKANFDVINKLKVMVKVLKK